MSAVRLYSRILRMKITGPVRSLVYNHRGIAHFALAQFVEALRDFTQAIRFDPGSARGHTNRAPTYRVLKDHARAVGDYGRALEIDPSCLDALWGSAQAQCDPQLCTRTLAGCEEVLHLRPDFTAARELSRMVRLGIFCIEAGGVASQGALGETSDARRRAVGGFRHAGARCLDVRRGRDTLGLRPNSPWGGDDRVIKRVLVGLAG